MDDVRKRAEEALRSCIRAMNEWAAQEDGLPDTAADAVEEALSALSLLASEPAKVSGSVSIVRSDDPPAKPLPTCVNCGSNFIEPAPPDAAEPAKGACAEFIRTMAKGKCAWTPEEGTTSCDGLGGVCAGHAAERFLAAPPASDEVREAAEELQRIDSLLARRITLDGLTRVQKIALALRVCEETDPKGKVAARYVCRGGQKGEVG